MIKGKAQNFLIAEDIKDKISIAEIINKIKNKTHVKGRFAKLNLGFL